MAENLDKFNQGGVGEHLGVKRTFQHLQKDCYVLYALDEVGLKSCAFPVNLQGVCRSLVALHLFNSSDPSDDPSKRERDLLVQPPFLYTLAQVEKVHYNETRPYYSVRRVDSCQLLRGNAMTKVITSFTQCANPPPKIHLLSSYQY